MIQLLLFAVILITAGLISRNNYKKRFEELSENLNNFYSEIIGEFNEMTEEKRQKFTGLLSNYWKPKFTAILNNNYTCSKSIWALQQQIVEAQELYKELHAFNKKAVF